MVSLWWHALDQRKTWCWKIDFDEIRVPRAEEQAAPNGFNVVACYVYGRGDSLQKTATGLLRSLMHQLLRQFLGLRLEFLSFFKQRLQLQGQYESCWEWHYGDLEEFLLSYLTPAVLEKPLKVYVDAIDELGESVALELVSFFFWEARV
jgi:hypothetical protein